MSRVIQLWHDRGTWLLGHAQLWFGALTAFLAFLSAEPSVTFLLPPRAFQWLALVSAVLGYLTKRRAKVNAARLNEGAPREP
jgi:hypothetical protein